MSAPEPAGAAPLYCSRCVKPLSDSDDDAAGWVMFDDAVVCRGCLTLNDRERLRADEDR